MVKKEQSLYILALKQNNPRIESLVNFPVHPAGFVFTHETKPKYSNVRAGWFN